ncbi:MAG: biotin/lipoyl-binding protein [Phycisphaera sp.]|nr:biotin/lipoyl-binding protein [Phycisphaera sp.]
MAVEFKLPELGEGIKEADVVEVLVSEGDVIAAKQDVFEAETEKASMPIPSSVGGKITKIHIKPGDTVKIGQTILTIDESASQDNGKTAKKAAPASEAKAESKPAEQAVPASSGGGGGATVDFKLPELGEGVKEADVVELLVAEGATVKKNQEVIDVEAEKGSFAVPINVGGTIRKFHVAKGDTVKPGQVILTIETSGSAAAGAAAKRQAPAAQEASASPAAPTPAPATSNPAPTGQPAGEPAPIAAAPSVRHFAREIGVDIYDVTGSGPGGRITEEDVKVYARTRAKSGGGAPASAAPDRVVREPMSKIRKVTARHMAKCWAEIPHVTLHHKADVTELEETRQQYKKFVEKKGGRLTITPIFVKLVASGLKVFRNLNASIDVEKGEVEYHNYVNIGVAVDTPKGLVVPVVRDADRKSIIEIAIELGEISEKARIGKLTLEDMSGGTFTITNLGSIGTGFFTPIVNSPEVAILGMGRGHREPVWSEERRDFVPRDMAPLSLSFDHRLVDGADGARFLQWIVEAVEKPLVIAMM